MQKAKDVAVDDGSIFFSVTGEPILGLVLRS